MAEEKKLNKYFEEYSSSILSKVGKDFSYSAFLEKSKSKNLRPSGLSQNYYEEKIDFPWLDELEMVTEKIMAIASKPRTHIKVEKDVKKAEQAVKIDNYDVIETLKVPAYWKRKGDRFLPEKVFTDIFEIEYAIYENRFITNLVDKMMLFLAQIVAQLYGQIKKIDTSFVDSHVPLSDIDIIQGIANFEGSISRKNDVKRNRISKEEKVTLLTTKDSPYVEALRRILQSRSNVAHVRSTPFYKDVKKAKPLSDTDVHLTNMLAGDATYAPCYNFYRKLLPLLTKNIDDITEVDGKDYHNFVMANLFAAFDELGFKESERKGGITMKDGLIQLTNYRVSRGFLDCFITSHDEDHVDLEFDISNSEEFRKTTAFKIKKHSRVSLDLVPCLNPEYPNVEEMTGYFRNKINSRIHKGYTNAFVITPIDGTQKDDVMICSPRVFKIDANVRSMIDSCTIFAEGDNYIYSHVCPVCGFYVDGEQDDGNCYCANCDSAYSLMVNGTGTDEKESVWIKRMKNPDRI